MSKKKINILLIIVVLSLWGTIGYKYINNYFIVERSLNLKVDNNMPIQGLVIERDTFNFKPLARDPFLNRNLNVSRLAPTVLYTVKTSVKKVNPKSNFEVLPVEWPEIHYYGYIKSSKNQELIIVKINGKISRMHKGQISQGLLVKSIYKDSILVVFNKQQKIIKSLK